MSQVLLLSVRFHDGRYHGSGDWPPAPARLFQALLAGSARGKVLAEGAKPALEWLEKLAPPMIAAPPGRMGDGYTNYVPNNDLDAALKIKKHAGNIDKALTDIRTEKTIRARIFDSTVPFLYLWDITGDDPEGERHASFVCDLAEELYQLGRGVDMAWACGEVLDREAGERRLGDHGGAVHYPNGGAAGTYLACPCVGSLDSLIKRHRAAARKFSVQCKDKPTKKDPDRRVKAGLIFRQPPKPRFDRIAYDSPPWRRLYDIRDGVPGRGVRPDFVARQASDAARLTNLVRDNAAARLNRPLPELAAKIERLMIGRNAGPHDKAQRIRIVPLPSIGHEHADFAIRRILVEVPPNCPIRADDLDWAFSDLDLGVDGLTGEVFDERRPRLLPADDDRMLRHYGIGQGVGRHRVWHSITPVVLPHTAGRGRGRMSAPERLAEEKRARHSIIQALRHAGIETPAEVIRVQREPFMPKGARAEIFAGDTRFSRHRLWHVEITFATPREGPVIIGDGRYLGLGLMAPVKNALRDHVVFPLSPETPVAAADAPALLTAVRRALMALSRDKAQNDEGKVPRLFSGHEADGSPARSNKHEHIFLAADDADNDGLIDRLIVAAPWACDRTASAFHENHALFTGVVCELQRVRAGRLGVIVLGRPSTLGHRDPLAGPAQAWESRTPYRATRHAGRGKDAATAVMQDVNRECRRRGLPRPEIEVLSLDSGPNGGNLAARLRLRFAVALAGPVLLGRDSHMGGGLFAVAHGDRHAGR